jgi:hypothetical protein
MWRYRRTASGAKMTVIAMLQAMESHSRSIKNYVRTARRYRTITIQAGPHTITVRGH